MLGLEFIVGSLCTDHEPSKNPKLGFRFFFIMRNTVLGLALVFLLVAANGFFVAVEFALIAVDQSKLRAMAGEGRWSAKIALAATKRMSFHLSGAQLGITITSLLLGFIAEPLAGTLLDPLLEPMVGSGNSAVSVVVALSIATVFQMVAGELVPKNIAIAKPEAVAVALLPIARVVHRLMSPFILVFNGAANWLIRRLGIEPQEELTSVRSLDEIEYLIRSSGDSGTLAPDALELLTRTIRFEDKTAADALTPRVHLGAVPSTATVGDFIDLSMETGHSRYPVYGEDIDQIVGVARITDVFKLPPSRRRSTPIGDIMRVPHIVPETRDLGDVLEDFRLTGSQLVIVVDEHGGTAGVLTLEDVLEEIAGDIDDEYDVETADLTRGKRTGIVVVAGTLHADEVLDASGFYTPEGEYETIAGFILDRLGRIPDEGDRLTIDGWRLEVAAMDGLRIASVQVVRPSSTPGPGDVESAARNSVSEPGERRQP